jgi:hypothetical protein
MRGFLDRAKEAAELARADDLSGLTFSEEMVEAAMDATSAWLGVMQAIRAAQRSAEAAAATDAQAAAYQAAAPAHVEWLEKQPPRKPPNDDAEVPAGQTILAEG